MLHEDCRVRLLAPRGAARIQTLCLSTLPGRSRVAQRLRELCPVFGEGAVVAQPWSRRTSRVGSCP